MTKAREPLSIADAVTEIANGFPIRLVVPCEGASYEVYAMSIVHGTPRMEGALPLLQLPPVGAVGLSAVRGAVPGTRRVWH